MTKRNDGKGNAAKYPMDPLNWYVEERFCVYQLIDVVDFAGDFIVDPTCGQGTILDAFADRGFPVMGCDIADRPQRPARHSFAQGDIFRMRELPRINGRATSIVSNPPYGKQGGRKSISTDIVRHVLANLTFRRAAFLVPIEFLCGQDRYAMFQRHKPVTIAYCSERPSMPPGAAVIDLGANAFKNGMADYCWIIFGPRPANFTEAIWLRPRGQ